MSKRTFIASVFISAVFLFQATAQADTDLKWANSVGEIIKPIKVEVDNSNADVGGVFVYVTYQMVRSCKKLYLFSRSMSADGVILNEASATHVDVPAGGKYRDMFWATYQKGHSVVLYKATCV